MDFESLIYLNAIREIINSEGRENTFVINVDFLQYVNILGQEKVESLQESIRVLNHNGIFPDAVVCRTTEDVKFDDEMKNRIANRLTIAFIIFNHIIPCRKISRNSRNPKFLKNKSIKPFFF